MKVYLDYNSTTPLDPRVKKAMDPYFSDCFYNPSASHVGGDMAKQAIEEAREQVASIIKAKSDQIYFTSSATEANNIIIRGWAKSQKRDWCNIFSTNSEHSSVKECLKKLHLRKVLVEYAQIKSDGNLDLDILESALKQPRDSTLVSIIAANNEIGTVHDLYKIGALCKKYNILFHTDATQAIGKVDIDVDKMNIFALTLSGHKIYGPKGVGCLYVRNPDLVNPLIYGGYQNTFSSGTQNVPSIVGVGEACRILQLPENKIENNRIELLRNDLLALLKKEIPDIIVNGTMENRLPNNLNVTIKGIQTEVLVKGMDDVMITGGSACTSGSIDPSHVIMALGSPYPNCAFRISLGRFTTKEEINYAAKRIIEIVSGIREQ